MLGHSKPAGRRRGPHSSCPSWPRASCTAPPWPGARCRGWSWSPPWCGSSQLPKHHRQTLEGEGMGGEMIYHSSPGAAEGWALAGEESRAEQGRAEQGRAEQSRGASHTDKTRGKTHKLSHCSSGQFSSLVSASLMQQGQNESPDECCSHAQVTSDPALGQADSPTSPSSPHEAFLLPDLVIPLFYPIFQHLL